MSEGSYDTIAKLKQRVDPFCAYFEHYFPFKKNIEVIHVVDYSYTGYSVQRLVFLIRQCFLKKKIEPPRLHFIKLADWDTIGQDTRLRLHGLQKQYLIQHGTVYPSKIHFMNDVASHYSIPRGVQSVPLQHVQKPRQKFSKPRLLQQLLRYMRQQSLPPTQNRRSGQAL